MTDSVDELANLIESELEPEKSGLVRALAEGVYSQTDRELLEGLDAKTLLELFRRSSDFLRRRPKEILIDAYHLDVRTASRRVPATVLQINLGDRPFIVDSVRAELKRQGIKPFHYLHPILRLRRDPEGDLLLSGDRGEERIAEAFQLILVPRQEGAKLDELRSALDRVLQDVILATGDHLLMRSRAAEIKNHIRDLCDRIPGLSTRDTRDDLEEYIAFLDWTLDHNFIFLGYRRYQIRKHQGENCYMAFSGDALGILRKIQTSTYANPVPLSQISPELLERLTRGPVMLVTKTNSESTVHRPVRMDYLGVKTFDENGQTDGEHRFLGLFTSKAQAATVREIPILRRKLARVLELGPAPEGSHDYKRVVAIANSMPKEELFWTEATELHREIQAIVSVEQERSVRVVVRPDPLERGLAVMVIMPRERFNSDVRMLIQRFLCTELEATHVDYQLAISEDEAQVRFHFFLTTRFPYENLDLARLNREISKITRTWQDQLREELVTNRGWDHAETIFERYEEAFSAVYRAENSPAQAASDIEILENLGASSFHVDLEEPFPDQFPEETSLLKIYHQGATLVLSRVFPILENLGLIVVEQISYAIRPDRHTQDSAARGIDIFRVQDRFGKPLDLNGLLPRLADALLDLLNSRAENDRMNQLILEAGLAIREVTLLRTYRNYLAQLQAATSRSFLTETLLQYPDCAHTLYRLFESRFDPAIDDRETKVEQNRARFFSLLDDVSSLPADDALRSLFQLVESTVRTNFYQGKSHISIKVRSELVRHMPDPRPLFEIFVSSPEMEGIHLRGGRVARGGIRWSDRIDDFRTEILGLMKTQMTKNAVIVPVGSKGGFVLRRLPAQPEQLGELVRAQYRTFIRGLLDLTDNIVDGKAVSPPGLVIHDEPDPYLVVAADKGTAAFSDTANEISAEFDFWLGDAFASGGSNGYDHKKEGITARGTWECVSRHFREMGINVREQEFTVVGIGDMSGDVFGNGLLYTDNIRLLAAFNHQHIFLDPAPDAKSGYSERKRLFQLPRSTWDDYDRSRISEGGGVFSRHSKAIPLSPAVRQMLGTGPDVMSAQELVRAILKMPVDLLWNGGIGTYVKASHERNTEVGDSGNDEVRIDAGELGARVVGEGGNLGLTQSARIEYALCGGRINTDAIDNSAGVDMSDHEVNLKILFQPLLRSGEIGFEKRNQHLEEMAVEVSRLVLRNNYSQSLALSLAQHGSRVDLNLFRSLIDELVETESLNVRVEFLPGSKTLQARQERGEGLTRPEIAVLLAYCKMAVQRTLLAGTLLEDPEFQAFLYSYFPASVREFYPKQIVSHPLRREIIACQISNTIVDRLGVTFLTDLVRTSGTQVERTTRATVMSLQILSLRPLWEQIFALDGLVPAASQYRAIEKISTAVRGIAEWILDTEEGSGSMSGVIHAYRTPLEALRTQLSRLLPTRERKRLERVRLSLFGEGFPEDLSDSIASMDYLASVMGVIDVSRHTGAEIEIAAREFYWIGERLALGWLRDGIASLPTPGPWEKLESRGLIADLRKLQRDLTRAYLGQPDAGGNRTFSLLLSRYPEILAQFDRLLRECRTQKSLDLVSAGVLTRTLDRLKERVLLGTSRRREGS